MQLLSCTRYGFKVSACKDIDCSGHGTCIEDKGDVFCRCDDGFSAQGLTCVAINLKSCEDAGDCNDQNECTKDSCNSDGYCIHTPIANGTSCEDGSACSSSDRCLAGMCTAGTTDKDSDGDGYYDAECSGGNDCDDNNKAIHPDAVEGPLGGPTCSDGFDNDCDGATDSADTGCVKCSSDANCDDKNPCTNDRCLPSGNCENLAVADGKSCNDNNACTQSDSCQAGKCVGADPITCTALDECHTIGVCDAKTGTCSHPPKTDGMSCDDNNACTQSDSCQAGVCTGANPVTCTALDNCHNVGTCNTSTGVCSHPIKTNGTSCSNGLFCDGAEICQSGICTDQADPCTVGEICNESTDSCRSLLSLSAGAEHSCATTSNQALKCFGSNNHGQIGDNSTIDRVNPTQVLGLTSNIREVSTRFDFSCAITTDGKTYCWGNNEYGKLGIGIRDNIDKLTPVEVNKSVHSIRISVGSFHVCVIAQDQTVWCWGSNYQGKLGDGTTTQRLQPMQVKGVGGNGVLSNINYISAGERHTCAVDTQKKAYCWGDNTQGELGDGTTTQRNTPVEVKQLSNVKILEVGYDNSCAITYNGYLYCWGTNADGELGDGTTTSRSLPVQVKGPGGSGVLDDVKAFARIWYHVCIAKNDGSAWCWGLNTHNALGDGTENTRYTPVQVKGPGGSGFLTNVEDIVSARHYSCARRSDGTVWCWGMGWYGNLGDGTGESHVYPVQANM